MLPVLPEIAVTPGSALLRTEPFSVPFSITNNGYIPIRDVDAWCYLAEVEFKPGFRFEGLGISSKDAPRAASLGHGGTLTLECPLRGAVRDRADIAVIVDHGFPLIPFWRTRSITRFIGAAGDEWQWRRQPPDGLRLKK